MGWDGKLGSSPHHCSYNLVADLLRPFLQPRWRNQMETANLRWESFRLRQVLVVYLHLYWFLPSIMTKDIPSSSIWGQFSCSCGDVLHRQAFILPLPLLPHLVFREGFSRKSWSVHGSGTWCAECPENLYCPPLRAFSTHSHMKPTFFSGSKFVWLILLPS